MRLMIFVLVVFGVGLLQGCGVAQHKATEVHNSVEAREAESRDLKPSESNGVIKVDSFYLGKGRVVERESSVLMQKVGAPGVHGMTPQTITQFARAFAEHTGLRIDIASDIYRPRDSGDDDDHIPIADSSGGIAQMRIASNVDDEEVSLPELSYRILPEETIKAALDRVVSNHGFGWRYDESRDRLVIFRYATARFDVPMPNASQSMSMKLKDSLVQSDVSSDVDTLENLKVMVESMITREGRVVKSGSSSMVVSDVPSTVATIKDVINEEIEKLGRQVLMQVKLFTIDNQDNANHELNWDLAYKNSETELSISSLATLGIIGGQKAGLSIINPTSDFAGSVVELDALAQQRGVSIAYENNFMTLSGIPVSASETRTTAYLKSVSKSQPGSGDRLTTTLEPGEIVTGLSMYLHPIVDGNNVIMKLSFNHNSLNNLNSEESGDSRITTPETSGRDVSQTVRLKNGGAVALSGFYTTSAETTEQGVGKPSFKLLGGGTANSAERRRAILVITATIME